MSNDDFVRLQNDMLEGRKARATVRHHLTALRHAFELAVGDGWLDANPSDGLAIVPLPKVEPDFNVLEPSQVAAAMAVLPDDEIPLMRNGQPFVSLEAAVRRTRLLWSELLCGGPQSRGHHAG
jgi:site-specific recombinase XerD